MLFNQPVQTVYVDTHTPAVESDMMLDIILSPSLYWVKRQELPVRYLREVKKLLPSLFDEMLPEGTYSYSAFKENGHYLLFAYNDKAILDLLGKKGIKPSQVRKVYLAQSEFSVKERAVQVGDGYVLCEQEGIVVKLPAAFVDQSVPMDLSAHKNSSYDVDLALYAHIADRGSMVRFGGFIALLTLLFAFEWGIVAGKTSQLEAKRAALFEQYSLKSTMLQNEAILSRLESRFTMQNVLRQATAQLLALKLSDGEHLSHYTLEGERLKASLHLQSQQRADAVAAQFKRAGLKVKHTFKGKTMAMEVTL
ncbi:MAG: hypothetical protein R3302_01690 [Sulfurimonadaceae bacterium]|nr:hypothetical protein [Sulfurimonadaceae bacterium]